ncbi:MAG TPA: hypothetical protein VHF65_06080 [Nitrososphaera sp.]|nr:hypothetical protein [Nitrososphaera sp.]
MNTNTKTPDTRAIQATELVARVAPNKSAKKPIPIAPKTKPKSARIYILLEKLLAI